MDFSVPGSDSWETTPTQELFIESYFNHKEQKESLSFTAQKKKRKMIAVDKNEGLKKNLNVKPSEDLQSTNIPSGQLLKSKKRKRKKKRETFPPSEEKESTEYPKNSGKFEELKIKTKKRKVSPATSIKTIIEPEYEEKQEIDTALPKESMSSLSMNKIGKKLQDLKNCTVGISASPKPKKLKLDKKGKFNLSKHSKCPSEESASFTTDKKSTGTKSMKNKKFKDIESSDSEDEEIRSEIKNSSIFKEIQKVMQEAPFLQNLEDSNDDVTGSCSDSDLSESGNIQTNDQMENIESPKGSPIKSMHKNTEYKLSNELLAKQHNPYSINSSTAEKKINFPRNTPEFPRLTVDTKDTLSKNKSKLQAAKFRFLNEKLYTETGENAFKYFQKNKEEFNDYHMGYSLQVSKWPMNPVNKIISDLEDTEGLVIADMGCGDAKIARTLTNSTVHSFDIVALNDHVTACNISKVPLAKESMDIVVFCLSLMGTNLKEYLLEAHRILKMGGTLKIAEVESRIEDVNALINKLKLLGFTLKNKDLRNKMFVFLDFKKIKKKVNKHKICSLELKPCLYKKR